MGPRILSLRRFGEEQPVDIRAKHKAAHVQAFILAIVKAATREEVNQDARAGQHARHARRADKAGGDRHHRVGRIACSARRLCRSQCCIAGQVHRVGHGNPH